MIIDQYAGLFAFGWVSWCVAFTILRVKAGSRQWHKEWTPLVVAFGWIVLPTIALSLCGKRISRLITSLGSYILPISIFIWYLPVLIATLYFGIELISGKNFFALFFFDRAAFIYSYH